METEKCHECTNMGQEKRLKLWWRLYCTSLPQQDVQNIRQTDFCSTECTSTAFYVSSTLMIMIYSIISLLNISFVSISCMIKKLSVWTRDAKWKWRYLEMLCTVKPGMLYAKSQNPRPSCEELPQLHFSYGSDFPSAVFHTTFVPAQTLTSGYGCLLQRNFIITHYSAHTPILIFHYVFCILSNTWRGLKILFFPASWLKVLKITEQANLCSIWNWIESINIYSKTIHIIHRKVPSGSTKMGTKTKKK